MFSGSMEGHHIMGYKDGGDMPSKELETVPGAVEDAVTFLARNPDTTERLARVSELVDGFETSFGLELLSTVHWVAAEDTARTDDEIIALTRTRGDRTSANSRNVRYAWHSKCLRDKWLD